MTHLPKKNKSYILTTVTGIALFVLCLCLTDFPDRESIMGFNPLWLSLAILSQGGFAIPMPKRWQLVSAGANVRIPYGPAFKITAYSSLAAAIVPQSLADLAGRGPWEARYTGCGILNATNIILCDRLLDVFIIGILFPPAMLLAYKILDMTACLWLAGMLLVAGFCLICLLREKFFLLFEFMFQGIRWACEKSSFLRGKFNWHVAPIRLAPAVIAQVYGLSVLKFFVMTFATMAYFEVVRIDVPFFLVFFALPVTQFVFIFAFTPGGLGIFEFGWVGILGMHGINPESIALFIVSQRICFTLGVLFWGGVAFCMRNTPLSPLKSAERY